LRRVFEEHFNRAFTFTFEPAASNHPTWVFTADGTGLTVWRSWLRPASRSCQYSWYDCSVGSQVLCQVNVTGTSSAFEYEFTPQIRVTLLLRSPWAAISRIVAGGTKNEGLALTFLAGSKKKSFVSMSPHGPCKDVLALACRSLFWKRRNPAHYRDFS